MTGQSDRDVQDPGGGAAGERTMWMGRPSQWLNFKFFFPGALLLAGGGFVSVVRPEARLVAYGIGAVVLLFMFWKWLVVRCTQLVLTNQRLSVREGVLSRRRHDIELYRIKDTVLDEPLLLRMVSLANIEIVSSDRSHPQYVIRAVSGAEPLRNMLRATVERLRATKNVRELDME
jgi:membrane protein YdbS with pleckstrin-like domain